MTVHRGDKHVPVLADQRGLQNLVDVDWIGRTAILLATVSFLSMPAKRTITFGERAKRALRTIPCGTAVSGCLPVMSTTNSKSVRRISRRPVAQVYSEPRRGPPLRT